MCNPCGEHLFARRAQSEPSAPVASRGESGLLDREKVDHSDRRCASAHLPLSTHHYLLRISAPKWLALEVAKLLHDLEPLRAHDQVQLLREETPQVQIFYADVDCLS